MLNPAYAAIKQFQSQISDINTIQGLKSNLSHSKLELLLKISSPTVWVLDWGLGNNTVSGTLELRLEPELLIGKEVVQMRATSFRLEDPNAHSFASLDERVAKSDALDPHDFNLDFAEGLLFISSER